MVKLLLSFDQTDLIAAKTDYVHQKILSPYGITLVKLATLAILNQPMAFVLASVGVTIFVFTFSGVVANKPLLLICANA